MSNSQKKRTTQIDILNLSRIKKRPGKKNPHTKLLWWSPQLMDSRIFIHFEFD